MFRIWAPKALAVQGLDTGCTVRGSNLDGGEIFRTQPWGPPSIVYNGHRFFFRGV